MELLLVRHAEPVRVPEGSERADPRLTGRGWRQAARLAEWLAGERVDAVWSSPADADPEAFRARVVHAIEAVIAASPGRRVVVVPHGGVLNAFAGHVIGVTRPLWFEPAYASITKIAASSGGVRSIVSLNETAHLRGL